MSKVTSVLRLHYKKGLLTKELVQVMQQYGVDVVCFEKKEEMKLAKVPEVPIKTEINKSKKLDIETRKKIVGDGVKKILDMSDEELVSCYDGKSEDEAMLEFLSLLTCFSIEFEDAFINWLTGFILRRLNNIFLSFSMNIPPKVQTTKKQIDYSNREKFCLKLSLVKIIRKKGHSTK